MSPYYDKAEGFIGVTGSKEGLRTAPDGNFLPPVAPRVHEQLVQKACAKLNIPVIPSRMAMLTKSVNGRAACHYCGQCGRGCFTASAFSSSQAMIFPAMKTGKLTVITGAMARELITDGSGKVTAVSYVDKATRTEKQIRCRAVVVAASACESARLLLNSKSARFSNGMANSSGMVGRGTSPIPWAMALSGYIPAMAGMPRHNSDGIGGMHVYVPWWLYDDKSKDFPRGYHIEIGGGSEHAAIGHVLRHVRAQSGLRPAVEGSYSRGVRHERRLRRPRRDDSRTRTVIARSIRERVDQFGIPVLRFHFQWSDAEYNQVKHMHQTFASIIETMGGRVSNRPFDSQGVDLARRLHHSRSRLGAHGRGPEDLGARTNIARRTK